MNGGDWKLVIVILLVVGGAYYLIFHSPWQPKPNYDGAPPKYSEKTPTYQVTTDPKAPTFSQHQKQEFDKKYKR